MVELMCGRYASSKEPAQLVEEFDVTVPPRAVLEPDFNTAPTKTVYAVLDRLQGDEEARLLQDVRWGLVPSWAKDPAIGNKMINARLETVAQKPSFRKAWRSRRAILPADGYYEWHTSREEITGGVKPKKQPYFIHRRDGATLAMAGLYEIWHDQTKDREDPTAWLWTATILTTTATGAMGMIHERMPIAVPRAAWDAWLDPRFAGDPHELLDPTATAAGLTAYPVSTLVNAVRNNGPHLLDPLPAEPT